MRGKQLFEFCHGNPKETCLDAKYRFRLPLAVLNARIPLTDLPVLHQTKHPHGGWYSFDADFARRQSATDRFVNQTIGGEADLGKLEAMLYSALWVDTFVMLGTVESESTDKLEEDGRD